MRLLTEFSIVYLPKVIFTKYLSFTSFESYVTKLKWPKQKQKMVELIKNFK